MRKTWMWMGLVILTAVGCLAAGSDFDGQRAYQAVKAQVDMGVRAPGTPGHEQCKQWIEDQFTADKLKVTTQAFDALPGKTPYHLTNVIGTLPGTSADTIVVGAHYDSKTFHNITFVGANDGGSGIGVLVELGRVLADHGGFTKTIQLVALDGEESIEHESMGVGLYGAAHFVKVAHRTNQPVKAFILVDMIGDEDLDINTDETSTPALHDKVWAAAKALHLDQYFNGPSMEVLDDHTPFLQAGIPAIDLIDFQYGSSPGANDYWHTAQDTFDKIHASSLETVGRVVQAVVTDMAR